MKFKSRLLVGLLFFALLFTACSNQGASNNGGGETAGGDGEVIKLGNSSPLTGPVSIYGVTANNGMKLAIDEINAEGGILGKEIQWIEYDDKGEITEAVTNYNKLVEDGVDAVFGGITSKPTLAMAEASVNDGIVFITATGTQDNITDGKPNVYRVAFTDPFQGEILARFSKTNLEAGTAAILRNQSSDYSMGISDVFVEIAEELGLEIVADESYGDNDTDFKAQLTNIKGQNPDVLLIPDYYEKVALIAPQVREAGIDAILLGADGWDTVLSVLDESSYSALENSYFANQFTLEDPSETVQEFITNYKEEYGEDPSTFAAEGYDTVYLYKQAVEEAGTTEWDAVIEALAGIQFDGITGSFAFDENNDPVKSAKMIRIEDGDYAFDSEVGFDD